MEGLWGRRSSNSCQRGLQAEKRGSPGLFWHSIISKHRRDCNPTQCRVNIRQYTQVSSQELSGSWDMMIISESWGFCKQWGTYFLFPVSTSTSCFIPELCCCFSFFGWFPSFTVSLVYSFALYLFTLSPNKGMSENKLQSGDDVGVLLWIDQPTVKLSVKCHSWYRQYTPTEFQMIKIVLHIMSTRHLGMWQAFISACRNVFSYFACESKWGSFLTSVRESEQIMKEGKQKDQE